VAPASTHHGFQPSSFPNRCGAMENRFNVRLRRSVKVKVRGVDASGWPFVQTAYTLNISPKGACLNGLECLQGRGQVIEICRWWKKARYRVVWMGDVGTAYMGQVGVFCVDQGANIWGIQFPPPLARSQSAQPLQPADQIPPPPAMPFPPQARTGTHGAFPSSGPQNYAAASHNFAVHLQCPYCREDQWVHLRGRSETLGQILSTSWDFECSLHGAQREMPLAGKEQ